MSIHFSASCKCYNGLFSTWRRRKDYWITSRKPQLNYLICYGIKTLVSLKNRISIVDTWILVLLYSVTTTDFDRFIFSNFVHNKRMIFDNNQQGNCTIMTEFVVWWLNLWHTQIHSIGEQFSARFSLSITVAKLDHTCLLNRKTDYIICILSWGEIVSTVSSISLDYNTHSNIDFNYIKMVLD